LKYSCCRRRRHRRCCCCCCCYCGSGVGGASFLS